MILVQCVYLIALRFLITKITLQTKTNYVLLDLYTQCYIIFKICVKYVTL